MQAAWSRRTYLKTGALVGLGTAALAGMSRSSAAAETATLLGTVTAGSGATIADDYIKVYGGNTLKSTRVDKFGQFRIEVPTNATYDLTLYKAGHRDTFEATKDGVPHIYEFGEYSVGEESKNVGELVTPRAYVVDFRVLDDDGQPLLEVEPRYIHDGWATPRRPISVNDEGYVVIEGASFTGAEFADHVTLEVDDDRERVSVDGPTTVTAVVGSSGVDWTVERNDPTVTTESDENAVQTLDRTETPYPGPATRSSDGESTTNPTASATETPRPGSASNEGADGGAIGNPFYLAVGGAALSAVGIVYGLVRRR